MKNCYFRVFWLLFFVTVATLNLALSQQLAFPGAEGFGRFTTGGRGGVVYEVTNLNDSGPGSFREGINMLGARTIVFRISGTIHLESELKIRHGNLTIAGQTAPGDGIALKGSSVVVDADNIIIRYIRFRPGDISGGEPDAIWGRNRKNIIIDHCSMSWAVDETSSFYDNENFTMQWCLLSESLYESQHEKGRHGYGGIWGGQGASFHHNILAHHSSRNPRFNGSRYSGEPDREIVDFRNNVIYNWGGNSAYGGEGGNHNIVANYYKAGPATSGEKRYRILDAYALDGSLGKWYVAENYVAGYPDVTANNWDGGVQRLSPDEIDQARVFEPFPYEGVTTQTAEEAYLIVLENAGANLPRRDLVDARIVEEIKTGTVTYGGVFGHMKGIIDSQVQVGGWPELFSAPAPEDTDHDGIPDFWEIENELNPEDPADGKMISENGYSNLELYLNSLDVSTEIPFLKYPTEIVINEYSTSTISLSWIDNEENEASIILERSLDNIKFDILEILDANTTRYDDEGLDAATRYYYRIKVANEADTSTYSQTIVASTLAVPKAPDMGQLVGHWGFDASSGIVVYDKSPYKHHGEISNSQNHSWIRGKVGNALDLSVGGDNTHVLLQHAENIAFDNTSFSVAFWMKATAQTQAGYILHKGTFGGAGKWFGMEVDDKVIRFAVDDKKVKSEVAVNRNKFRVDDWVQVVVVRDREDKTIKIYRDGVLAEGAFDNTTDGIFQPEPLILANSSDLNLPFKGSLDELMIFNYALDASEIAGLFVGVPMKAMDPIPQDNAAAVATEQVELTWVGDATAYNLYVGTTANNLELIAEALEEDSHLLSNMQQGITYYWRVDAIGHHQLVTKGDVWSFETAKLTSVDGLEIKNTFQIFPNPFTTSLHIELSLEQPQKVQVAIRDLRNRLIYIKEETVSKGLQKIELNSDQLKGKKLTTGIYFCIVKTSKNKYVERILYVNE